MEYESSFGPSGWGGAVTEPDKVRVQNMKTKESMQLLGEPTKSVYGQWTVPGIFPVSDPADNVTAGFWVGIDGYGGEQVLQAGIAVTVTPAGKFEWWAWTEWWTDRYKDPPLR